MGINEQIANRVFHTGMCENTYYTQALYDMWVDNYNDPDILFKIKILGYYKSKYKWTVKQCWDFINTHIEDSRGHTVGSEYFAYDWGSGKNKVTRHKMHEPHLDHILPRERGGKDVPENMRIRCGRLNENKGNTNSDIERWATILDMWSDIENKESFKDSLLALVGESK